MGLNEMTSIRATSHPWDVDIVVRVVIVWDQRAPVLSASKLDFVGIDITERSQVGLSIRVNQGCFLIVSRSCEFRIDAVMDLDISTENGEFKPVTVEKIVVIV